MDEPDQPESSPSSLSWPESGECSGDTSSSTSVSHVRRGGEEEDNVRFPLIAHEGFTCNVSDDTCSCITVLITLWFLVSVALIVGVYGSSNLRFGPNCSFLIKPSPIFVEYVKVKQLDDTIDGPSLYGFYDDPPLDVLVASSESHSFFLPTKSQKDWIYFLNKGSQMNISIAVNSSSSLPLILVIAEGTEGLAQWLDDPAYPNTTLSWNMIHGNGLIRQDITKSSNYYVSVGNLNSQILEMRLNITIRALVYSTTKAYYNCSLAHGECSYRIFFPKGNAAVLTTPVHNQGSSGSDWYVELSYGPRWITYFAGIGGMTFLVFSVFHSLNNCECAWNNRTGPHDREVASEHPPLVSHKDDDLSSLGSSYDSSPNDDGYVSDEHAVGVLDGQPKDGEINNSIRRLCAICYDGPRDCFFIPCGHCLACFACGKRIIETAGTCPMCRRIIKKVRKIYIV